MGDGETRISGLGDEANFAMYALTVGKGRRGIHHPVELAESLVAEHAERRRKRAGKYMRTIFSPWIKRWRKRR